VSAKEAQSTETECQQERRAASAGFENRPAESVIDGQMEIFSAFSLPCDGLRPLKEALPDTGFSLAREKRLALFFISVPFRQIAPIGAGASAQRRR